MENALRIHRQLKALFCEYTLLREMMIESLQLNSEVTNLMMNADERQFCKDARETIKFMIQDMDNDIVSEIERLQKQSLEQIPQQE